MQGLVERARREGHFFRTASRRVAPAEAAVGGFEDGEGLACGIRATRQRIEGSELHRILPHVREHHHRVLHVRHLARNERPRVLQVPNRIVLEEHVHRVAQREVEGREGHGGQGVHHRLELDGRPGAAVGGGGRHDLVGHGLGEVRFLGEDVCDEVGGLDGPSRFAEDEGVGCG